MPELSELPFTVGREALRAALENRGAAVVQAPPGTGKTTLAPQYVAEYTQAKGLGKVIVTQPRRVAARAAATRIATLRGSQLGDEVGYTVRGDRKAGPETIIEMVTPGVLLRRLLADPDLMGVGAVIVDEIHERHLESDLVFALLAQVRELRSGPDDQLCVIAMSATLDATRFAALLGDQDSPVPVVDVASPIYPLDIRYAGSEISMVNRDRRSRTAVEDTVIAMVRRALTDGSASTGDILAFVPTIRGTEILASALCDEGVDAVALHGRLNPTEQARIVSGRRNTESSIRSSRRVVVATDVAESSLTVPGIRTVVDSCLSRVSRRNTTRGMSVLVTETASQASMTQRAGRAGRLGPGTVYRCITAEQYAKAPASSPPAILTSDLTAAVLDVACWGSPRGSDLALPDPFPATAMLDAEELLRHIGAVDVSGAVTGHGRRLAHLPTDPRLAHGGLTAMQRVDTTTVARVLAVLDGGSGSPADLPHKLPPANDPVVRRFRRILDDEHARVEPHARSHRRPHTHLHGTDAVAYTVACSLPDLVAHRVTGRRFLTTSGTGAVWTTDLASHSGDSDTDWIAVADIAGASDRSTDGTGAVIRAAVPLDEKLAFAAADHLARDEIRCTWSPGGPTGKLSARRIKALGAVQLSATPVPVGEVPMDARAAAVLAGLREHGLGVLPWSENAEDLRRRIHYLHQQQVPGYPDVADATRAERLLEFVVPELSRGRRPDLAGLLRGLLPWDVRLDEDAPPSLDLPLGRSVRLTYPDIGIDGPVVASTKLQHCFGLHASPMIAGRRIQFHLLSPAQRPVAVTDDLAGFWSGAYAQVRSDLRGRYPKHSWPERP